MFGWWTVVLGGILLHTEYRYVFLLFVYFCVTRTGIGLGTLCLRLHLATYVERADVGEP